MSNYPEKFRPKPPEKDNPNPRKHEIDEKWQFMVKDLQSFNGRSVADTLSHLREDDRGLWNALYWRTNNWLAGYMGRYQMSEQEEAMFGENRLELGRYRLTSFLRRIYPDREFYGHWNSEDMVFIMQELGRASRPAIEAAS